MGNYYNNIVFEFDTGPTPKITNFVFISIHIHTSNILGKQKKVLYEYNKTHFKCDE